MFSLMISILAKSTRVLQGTFAEERKWPFEPVGPAALPHFLGLLLQPLQPDQHLRNQLGVPLSNLGVGGHLVELHGHGQKPSGVARQRFLIQIAIITADCGQPICLSPA